MLRCRNLMCPEFVYQADPIDDLLDKGMEDKRREKSIKLTAEVSCAG